MKLILKLTVLAAMLASLGYVVSDASAFTKDRSRSERADRNSRSEPGH